MTKLCFTLWYLDDDIPRVFYMYNNYVGCMQILCYVKSILFTNLYSIGAKRIKTKT